MNKVASAFAALKATLPVYHYLQANAEDDVDSKLNVDANTVVPPFPRSVNDGNNEADVSGANPTDCQGLVIVSRIPQPAGWGAFTSAYRKQRPAPRNPPTGRLGCFHFSLYARERNGPSRRTEPLC
jgi:hypothetical protein